MTKAKNIFLKIDEKYKFNDVNCVNIVKYIKKALSEFEQRKMINLTFKGVSGCGKTYLSGIISRFLRAKGYDVKFIEADVVYREYLKILKSNAPDSNQTLTTFMDQFKADFLVYDDLGDEKPTTEKSKEFVSEIIKIRHKKLKKSKFGFTIYTTNLDDKQIEEQFGSRTLSRLLEFNDYCVFGDKDFRRGNNLIIRG